MKFKLLILVYKAIKIKKKPGLIFIIKKNIYSMYIFFFETKI